MSGPFTGAAFAFRESEASCGPCEIHAMRMLRFGRKAVVVSSFR
jgi:hypothetical protein